MNQEILKRLVELEINHTMLGWWHENPDEQTAWEKCPRGDWMLDLLARCTPRQGRRQLFGAKAACARLALPLYECLCPDKLGPRRAIMAAEAYARGELNHCPTTAALAASDAADVAKAVAFALRPSVVTGSRETVYAWMAASRAASAACSAAIDGAILTALAASYAADAAAYDTLARRSFHAGQNEMLSKCANAVRQIFPNSPKI